MINPAEFCDYVRNAKRNKVLLARVALNTIPINRTDGTERQHSVDLFELNKLTSINRAVVAGFLNWCSIEDGTWWPCEAEDLDRMAKGN